MTLRWEKGSQGPRRPLSCDSNGSFNTSPGLHRFLCRSILLTSMVRTATVSIAHVVVRLEDRCD